MFLFNTHVAFLQSHNPTTDKGSYRFSLTHKMLLSFELLYIGPYCTVKILSSVQEVLEPLT
jgi:hypothetical protein